MPSFANNLKIGTPSFSNKQTTTLDVSFSVSQSNTFSTPTNTCSTDTAKDCAWIFMKYSTNSKTGPWNHCTITGVSSGDDASTTIQSVSDSKGVFIFANANRSQWTSGNVTVRWNFGADGLGSTLPSEIRFRVMGIEMVYISTGSYVYNVGGIGGSGSNNFGAGSQVVVASTGDVPTGCSNNWPNGYRAFYLAKYEVSQRQYADFLNTVDPNGTSGSAYYDVTQYNQNQYYILIDISRQIGDRYFVASGMDNIGCNCMSDSDSKAYAAWSGLRPMTEMEFERAGRGCNNTNIWPWGNVDPSSGNTQDNRSGTSYHCELYYANCVIGSNVGPVGQYLSGLNISGSPQTRTSAQTGASPYGIADLSGNDNEEVIRCDYTTTPTNGTGQISSGTWQLYLIRGGNYGDNAGIQKISDRSGTLFGGYRFCWYGFRPARTP